MGNIITKPSAKDNSKFGNNELKMINEQEVLGKRFRVYGTVDEPLFLAKDVANWIEHSNVTDMVSRVDSEEVTKLNLGGLQGECNFLTENGVYEVLMQSRKPIAKQFKSKVKEILKTLRKTGGYISNSDMFVSMYFGELDEGQRIVIKTILDNVEEKQKQIAVLNRENDVLAQKRLEWNERATINAVIRACGAVIGFEDAWREFKMELLYQYSINLNQRITNYLNETGKKTKPKTLDMLHDVELPQALSTAVAMCRKHNVDISGILETKIQ